MLIQTPQFSGDFKWRGQRQHYQQSGYMAYRTVSLSNTHKINDFSHRAVTEDCHTNDQPDHGFEEAFTLTQSHGIGKSQRFMNKLCENELGQGAGMLR